MMNIAVDIGNTRLKCGLCLASGESWINTCLLPPVEEKLNQGVLSSLLSWEILSGTQELLTAKVCPEPFTWQIAPTGRCSWEKLKEAILLLRPNDRFDVITHKQIPLKVNVDAPEKVGLDRLLAAFAAVRLYGDAPMLIVDAGSATTVDVVKNRTFCGGAILPGLVTLSESYQKISDKLPHVPVPFGVEKRNTVPSYPGKNTKEAIQSGYYWGIIGAIRQFYTMSFPPGQCVFLVLTGGDGQYLFQGLSEELPPSWIKRHGFLVLEGISQCFAD